MAVLEYPGKGAKRRGGTEFEHHGSVGQDEQVAVRQFIETSC